jgi:predicted RNA binding protein YcfA (HicA-like mRNA interferase family)
MKIPRDLSGEELAKKLCRNWGYRVVHQEGSHVVLETDDPSHQRIAVPAHRSLRIGTLNAILRAVARHKGVERSDLLK